MRIKKGDEVLLISEEGHEYVVLAEDKTVFFSDGQLDLKQLVGSSFGNPIKTHLGNEYQVVQLNFLDRLKRLKRGPQVVLPKDAASIIAHTGLKPGSKVVDAGTGSGWLTSFLAKIVGREGKVVSYEKRKDFHELSKENIKNLGLTNVTLKNKDITAGISEKNLDLITLDLLTPAKVPNISSVLKLGGYCVAYVPHLNQAEEFAGFASKQGLFVEKVLETREYENKFQGGRLRKKKPFPHTGFMVFARKVKE